MGKNYKQLWNNLKTYMQKKVLAFVEKENTIDIFKYMFGTQIITTYKALMKEMDKMENGVACCDRCGKEITQDGAVLCDECFNKQREEIKDKFGELGDLWK